MRVPDAPLRIDEILRRPVVIVESAPDNVLAVDGDRIVDPQCFDLPADVVDVLSNLNSGVWTPMTTNPLSLYFSAQARTVGLRAQPIDAGVVQNGQG
jgi:hypothetical protein